VRGKVLPDEDSECEPPDPIPNSEVKPLSADGSVGLPHVRVGHRQALKSKTPPRKLGGVFYYFKIYLYIGLCEIEILT
jgi:hypothetical protein